MSKDPICVCVCVCLCGEAARKYLQMKTTSQVRYFQIKVKNFPYHKKPWPRNGIRSMDAARLKKYWLDLMNEEQKYNLFSTLPTQEGP
jgi:hypothetical protein